MSNFTISTLVGYAKISELRLHIVSHFLTAYVYRGNISQAFLVIMLTQRILSVPLLAIIFINPSPDSETLLLSFLAK